MKYYKDKEGEHFYKMDEEKILHVLVRKISRSVTSITDRFTMTSEVKKGESLINSLDHSEFSVENLQEASQDEFENVLREAIFNLRIFEYTKTL